MDDVKTQPISREELAEVFKTPRLIRAMENLLRDVSTVLPNSVSEVAGVAADASERAEAANVAVQRISALLGAEYLGAPSGGDDTAAVMDWVSRIKSSGRPGITGFGTYNVSEKINFGTHTASIIGQGSAFTTFKAVGLTTSDDFMTFGAQQKINLSGFRVTTDSGARNAVVMQYTGGSTAMLHSVDDLHVSNFQNGAGIVANNMELSDFRRVYIFQCLDGFMANNTGNGTGNSASCLSNTLRQMRVFGCLRHGYHFQNWAVTKLDRVQALQNGKTGGTSALGTKHPEHIAQIYVAGSCHSIEIDDPDVEEYVVIDGAYTFQQLTNGIQMSGGNHRVYGGNFYGLDFPVRGVSVDDFMFTAPKVSQCKSNFTVDSASTRVVGIIPRQTTAQSSRTLLLGGGVSGYAGAPSLVSSVGTTNTMRLPRVTTAQRDALIGVSAGDEIYNTTLNKKQFWNGSAWETITSS